MVAAVCETGCNLRTLRHTYLAQKKNSCWTGITTAIKTSVGIKWCDRLHMWRRDLQAVGGVDSQAGDWLRWLPAHPHQLDHQLHLVARRLLQRGAPHPALNTQQDETRRNELSAPLTISSLFIIVIPLSTNFTVKTLSSFLIFLIRRITFPWCADERWNKLTERRE